MRFTYGVLIALALTACGSKNTGGTDDGGPGDDQPDADFPDGPLQPDADLCTGGTLCGTPLSCCPAGNECVLDQCVTTCTTGIYCGANLATCCAAGQVCSDDACVDPGASCNDSYDCDPGNFCEPTLHQCLPQPDPLTCKIQPLFDDLQVTLEHSYTAQHIVSIPVVANLDGVGAPEIVINTTLNTAGDFYDGQIVVLDGSTFAVKLGPILDNRGDMANPTYASQGRSTIAVGDVDGDGLPDIIYAAKKSAISGPGNAGVNGFGSGGSVIIAIKGDGTFLWKSHLPGTPTLGYSLNVENGAPTLAQFDDDKGTEVMFGGVLIDNDGTVIWDGGATAGAGATLGSPSGYLGGIASVAELDQDVDDPDGMHPENRHPEIITGFQAWKVNWNKTTPALTTVTQYWKVPAAVSTIDGWPGVANFSSDATDKSPEVVLVANGKVIVLNAQTGGLWCAKATCATPADYVQPISIPGGGRGGNPTVADFDGDGRPEIGVAGGASYSVYDIYRVGEDVTGVAPAPTPGQLFVRWSKTTQDASSNVTGSSVFDFQGDGSAEVVYEDECFVRVYSGTDGREQLKLPNLTGTIHEYPLVVDADGDGNSEILIVANENGTNPNACPTVGGLLPANTTHKGLFMYGDTNDKWVPTRKVWTQHAYHVTNATNAGNVPDFPEDNNWLDPKLNDYRKNAQGEGVFNAPNLTVELAVGLDHCDTNMLTLRARVTNVGALGVVPGTTVEFRLNDATGTVLGSGTITTPLLPGGSGVVKIDVAASVGMNFWAGVDGAPAVGAVAECNELDNQDTAIGAHCPIIF
ncbi:hypothetical protein BH11MYX2_BH11MYX2_09770 [soil metagenome]